MDTKWVGRGMYKDGNGHMPQRTGFRFRTGMQIECRPATELIAEYNYKNVLIYCDPPYMAETRSGGTQYKKEDSGRYPEWQNESQSAFNSYRQ